MLFIVNTECFIQFPVQSITFIDYYNIVSHCLFQVWRVQRKRKDRGDGYEWMCPQRRCRSKASIRESGFFKEGASKSTLKELVAAMFMFSYDMQLCMLSSMLREIMAPSTVSRWYNFFRDMMSYDMTHRGPQPIGGPGVEVQIDESFFSGRRKNNVGRVGNIQGNPWVLGCIDITTKRVCMFEVPNRTRGTLHGLIQRYVAPGSIIITDCWAAYRTLDRIPGMNYTHRTVNHKRHFVNPMNGAHTQEIEGFWSHAKKKWKTARGFAPSMRQSYLDEIQWRWNNKNVFVFTKLLKLIREHPDYLTINFDHVPQALRDQMPEPQY